MRIKKFNESLEKIDIDYIKLCFAELLDNKANIREDSFHISGEKSVFIMIEVRLHDTSFRGFSRESISKNNRFCEYLNSHNKNNEILLEIQNSTNKLADEYPNYLVNFTFSKDFKGDYISVNIYTH